MHDISGKTQLYGVIGDPVEHSLSPTIQNAAFQALEIDSVFFAFRVPTNQIQNAMMGIRGLGLQGLNVTMPHKKAVIPYLDGVDKIANFTDSVNTIVNKQGRLRGYSTDGIGAFRALRQKLSTLAGKKLVMLGAGGAARAIAFSLSPEVGEIVLLNRTPKKAEDLSESIKQWSNVKVSAFALNSSTIEKSLKDADIIINATKAGMQPNVNQSLVKPKWLNPELTVMDIVYKPLETKLLKNAKEAGAKVINGLEMLIYQGAASFEIWTGKKAPVEIMREAALSRLEGNLT
jgi:shikimate dehydrogenase